MINTCKVKTIKHETISITCDVCKITYKDPMEIQEVHTIRFTGGYGSVFGDGFDVACDVCQHCLINIFGEYYREDLG